MPKKAKYNEFGLPVPNAREDKKNPGKWKCTYYYFKENGATNIRLSTKESNVNAIRLYRSFGFEPNGDENDGETVFELKW